MKRACHNATGHVPGCRVTRPLCAPMRALNPQHRKCDCPLVPFPHRRGYCQSRSASALAWTEETEESYRERTAANESEGAWT